MLCLAILLVLKAPFTREHFSNGPLLNYSMVVNNFKNNVPRVKKQHLFLLSKFSCKIMSNIAIFLDNHAKIKQGTPIKFRSCE